MVYHYVAHGRLSKTGQIEMWEFVEQIKSTMFLEGILLHGIEFLYKDLSGNRLNTTRFVEPVDLVLKRFALHHTTSSELWLA